MFIKKNLEFSLQEGLKQINSSIQEGISEESKAHQTLSVSLAVGLGGMEFCLLEVLLNHG